jgi:hypothetical protein
MLGGDAYYSVTVRVLLAIGLFSFCHKAVIQAQYNSDNPVAHEEVWTMKEKAGPEGLGSSCRPGVFLGFLCITTLVLIGCAAGSETPQPVAEGPRVFPHSMKGYELYSWQEGQEWHFTLITGTNRLKGYEEIVSAANVVTESDWVKLSVQGTESLRTVLKRLPEGETVTWKSGQRLRGAGAPGATLRLPDAELIEEIERYCRPMSVRFQVAN